MNATFPQSPDSFWLTCPAGDAGITVRPYLSPFGETDELLCYAGAVLIGRLLGRGDDAAAPVSIDLLPRLDRLRRYDWPDAGDFHRSLLRILRQVPGAVLSCERDTGQADVEKLANDGELASALELVIAYCLSTGTTCPSFIYSRP